MTPFGGYATTPAVTANTGAGVVTATAGSNTTPTSTTTSPKATSTSTSSTFGNLTTAEFVGIIVGGLIVLTIAMSIWRYCKAKVRKSINNIDRSNRAGPSMLPAYIPTNIPIYEPAPTRTYREDIYDPVLERHAAVSPMSPRPMTPRPITPSLAYPVSPSPAYSAVDQHELAEGRGIYDPIEVHGVGTTRGRAEME